MDLEQNVQGKFHYLMTSLIVGVIYFLVAKFSLLITIIPTQTSIFYIPSGFAIAVLIFLGLRYLPIIFLAKLILGISIGRSNFHNVVNCMASVAEAYVGYYLYVSFKDSIKSYFEYQSTLITVLLIGAIAPIFSALIGATNLLYLGLITDESYFSHFLTWYAGDFLSILIFLPAFLSTKLGKFKFINLLTPILAYGIASIFKFQFTAPYLLLIFSAILIPAIFSSASGIYYSLISVTMSLNWFLINHSGPFSSGSYSDNTLSMQLFLCAIALSALSLEGFKKTGLLKNALIPLVSFWFLTGVIYYHYYQQKEISNEKVVSNLIQDFENRLIEKMGSYQNAIKGASGFVTGSEIVENYEWNEYVKSISIVDSDYGIKGLGIIFSPNKKRPGYVYFYPANSPYSKNLEHLINHPDFAYSFQKALVGSSPVLSRPILNHDRKIGLSFLIYPVKKNNSIIAWTIAPIEMGQFFKGITQKRYQAIDIDIYDGERIDKDQKIFSKVVDERLRNKNYSLVSTLIIADRPFVINWNETLRYVTSHNAQNSLIILAGCIFSVIFTGFFLNLNLIGLKANKIADSKTLELRESEEKFKSLFENSSDGVILFNNHDILDCNPESLNLFGKRSKKELINTPLFEFFSIRGLNSVSDNKEMFVNKVKEVKVKKMVKFECFCLRSGLPFFAEIHLHYIEVNDKFIYQAVVRDISERKKIEHNLTKSKELAEEAARAKSNFLSTMSHEIRTPLNGVIGMINIILDENPKSENREDLETIKYSADNLLHIVNEVLDYNKIESGKIVLEKNAFSLKNLCENILKIHRPLAIEKQLQLVLDFDPKIPDILTGDEYRNNQILNNLLSNSLKFTDSGEVSLHVRLKQKKEDSCIIEFKVKDTGIGIDKNKQREIFKDFTQAESDHTRKYGGTGLGLAITKRLVEIQNGKIEVSSTLHHGTIFTYTINFKTRSEQPNMNAPHSTQKGQEGFNGQKILLVEDNQVNIIVTKKFLEKWGLKVDVAINGLEAVNHVRAIHYDLILMDLHMPLMDGFEATKRIREFDKETPIIGLSADVMTESVSSLQAIGMNDFVTKPFRPNDFFQKLKSFI